MTAPAWYQPKGGMCRTCQHASRDCSKLPFKTMPLLEIERKTGAGIVRCTEHKRIGSKT